MNKQALGEKKKYKKKRLESLKLAGPVRDITTMPGLIFTSKSHSSYLQWLSKHWTQMRTLVCHLAFGKPHHTAANLKFIT